MVLRCSLLGHDYGDPEVDREREERGSEVVVTVQEYEECSRCGDRHVVSENTEVTSLTPGAGADGRRPADDEPQTPVEQSGPEPDGAESAEDDGVIISDAETDDPVEDAPSAPSADDGAVPSDHPTDDAGEPVTDDGEILEAGPDDRERDRGAWPESTDVGPPAGEEESVEWPDDDPADWPEPDDEPPKNDAVILEHTDPAGSPAGESVATDADVVDADAETDPGSGIERAEPAPNPGATTAPRDDDVPTEFYCPRCEFVRANDRGSLRAGDICPDCRKGYLGERPVR